MGSLSVWHWLVVLIVWVALPLPPIARILRKAGRSRWWCLIALIPIVNIVGLWTFAFTSWPARRVG